MIPETLRDVSELESVGFIAEPLKLSSSTAKLRLIHYVEGDRYQLPFIAAEVTVKVAKECYPALLKWIREKRLIVKVEEDKVTLVEPFRQLLPIPKYLWQRDSVGTAVISRSDFIETAFQTLSSLPYVNHHQSFSERHEIHPREMLSLRSLGCGCCSELLIVESVLCKKCCSYQNVRGVVLGYWALFRSSLPTPKSFSCRLDDNQVTVSIEGGEVLTRKMDNVIRDLFSHVEAKVLSNERTVGVGQPE